MKLTTVEISDYKCIRTPCNFDVSDITCFVGKNESGKTAVLEALYHLNPIIPEHGDFNVDDDYPRIDVEDYRLEVERGRREPAIVTRATFSLEDEDRRDMEADFPGILSRPELVLSKGYGNKILAQLMINERDVVGTLLSRARLTKQQLKELSQCSTVPDLASSLKSLEKGGAAKDLAESVNLILDKGLHQYLFERYLENRVPKFLYFDEFYQMEGHINIQALIQRQRNNELLDSDYPLLGIIDLARLNLEEIVNPRRALERGNRLEGASNHLTQSIMKYWSQNRELEMRFDIRPGLPEDPPGMQSGTNLWCYVYNSRQKVSTLLGRRSRGFVWFFSFLAWFSQQKRKNIPLILLLDEPSLFLHASAQKDLLRFMEDECRSGLQVVYTTQSPYMVDPNRLDRVRILEDRSIESGDVSISPREGTQVYTDALQVHRESIMPLEGALGYQLSLDLFPGTDLLLVESIYDLIYLQAMSGLLAESGRIGLDARWTITPIGGAHELPVFLSLMGYRGNQRMACLFSGKVNEQEELQPLFERNILRKESIYLYGDFAESPVAGVEDLFDTDFYLYLVNSAYLEVMTKPISKVHPKKKNRKIVDLVAELVQSMPEADRVRFTRFKPAKFFLEHGPALKSQISPQTYDRFGRIYEVINASP